MVACTLELSSWFCMCLCVCAASPNITHIYSRDCSNTTSPLLIIDCPRRTGTTLTLEGMNFGAAGAVVLVGSSLCLPAHQDVRRPHRLVTCILPDATGLQLPVLLLQGLSPSAHILVRCSFYTDRIVV